MGFKKKLFGLSHLEHPPNFYVEPNNRLISYQR